MLIKLLTCQPDYEKALKNRRLASLALLGLGLVGLACYFFLVPGRGLNDYAQGFYLGASSGITIAALLLLLRTWYLQTHPAAQKQARIKETDEREVQIVQTALRLAGIVSFYAAAVALFVVLPLSREAFTALLCIVFLYGLSFPILYLCLSRTR